MAQLLTDDELMAPKLLSDADMMQSSIPIAKKPPPPSWGEIGQDVVDSTGRGLVKGLGYMAGGMGDIANMIRAPIDKGYQYLLTGALSKLGVLTPEQADKLYQNMPGEAVFNSGDQINRVTEHAITGGKGYEEPKTGWGRTAETVASLAPGALTSAGSLTRLQDLVTKVPQATIRYAVLPGVASEAAGELTKGTALEGPARFAGGMAGAGAGAAIPRSRATIIGNATEGVTPAQWEAAQRLVEWSHQPGNAPLTAVEALQQVTSSGTGLANLMRVIEQSEGGGGQLRQMFSDRPQANQAMADRHLPATLGPLPGVPSEIPGRVQGAAEKAIQRLETARTNLVTPDYRAAATDRVPVPHVEDLLTRIDDLIA